MSLLRWLLGLSLLGTLIYLFWLPNVRWLKKHHPEKSALMELREEQARERGKRLKSVMIWRDFKDISPNLVHAVLISEDDTFYQHQGFDLEQIRVAIQRDWAKRRWAYGGSTITQQLARTLYLSPHKNLLRKAKEALITIQLERTLGKKRILELYLNYAEWGKGLYGCEAAARAYFNKSAGELTPDEAVAMASVLPSPRRWSPLSERAFMARRRTQLLERMARAGYLPTLESSTTPEGIQPGPDGLFVPDSPAPAPSSGSL